MSLDHGLRLDTGDSARLMVELAYILTPFLAWLAAGVIKFLVNSIRAQRLAFDRIGYGGLPSNHSAISSSMAILIALKEGIGDPAFGLALTLALIVMLDAHGLRRQVGKHAATLNKMAAGMPDCPALRERMGHSLPEILAGIAVGGAVAAIVNLIVA